MKNLLIKGMSVIILAIIFMSFTTKSSLQSVRVLTDEYGRFQLAVKKVSPGLEANKDLKAYVKISRRQSREVVFNTVINARYANGQIVSNILELPLGEYQLDQLIIFSDNNSDESNASIKIQLPLLFSVTEKP